MTEPTTAADRFHSLFARHYRAIYSYAARRLGADQAADVAADVFTVAWRRMDAVPAEPDTLPWLYGVARRTVSSHRRSLGRQRRLAVKLGRPGSESGDPTDALAVRAALAELKPDDQEILALSAWEGLEPRHIAVVLGCSPNAAAVRLHRARTRLAEALEPGAHS